MDKPTAKGDAERRAEALRDTPTDSGTTGASKEPDGADSSKAGTVGADSSKAKADKAGPDVGKPKSARTLDAINVVAPVYRPPGGTPAGETSDDGVFEVDDDDAFGGSDLSGDSSDGDQSSAYSIEEPRSRKWIGLVLLGLALVALALILVRCTGDGDTSSDTAPGTAVEQDADAEANDEAGADDNGAADQTPGSEVDGAATTDEPQSDGEDGPDEVETASSESSEAYEGWDLTPISSASGPTAELIRSAAIGSTVWAVDGASGALHSYDPAGGWTQTSDPLEPNLIAEDLSRNADGVTVLVTDGDLGVAVGSNRTDDRFEWQPFELPADTPAPSLLASADAGHLIGWAVADAAGLSDRNAQAAALLADAGIDLSEDWIAGADRNAVTYLDPAVPALDWSDALLTTTPWSAFGIDQPDWSVDPERLAELGVDQRLYLVTPEAVIETTNPFGPDQLLVELNTADGDFEAITWNGSTVEGPTLWQSSDAVSWRNVGPTVFSGSTMTQAVDGAGIVAGDHQFRLRTLGNKSSVLEYRPGAANADADAWERRQLTDLIAGRGSPFEPERLLVGPSAIVITASHIELDEHAVLLSRDGTVWEVVTLPFEPATVTIANTYVLVADDSGASVTLTPTR